MAVTQEESNKKYMLQMKKLFTCTKPIIPKRCLDECVDPDSLFYRDYKGWCYMCPHSEKEHQKVLENDIF